MAEGEGHLGDADKQKKTDQTFAEIILKDGSFDLSEPGREALKAMQEGKAIETSKKASPAAERKEAKEKFLALSESMKLFWLTSYKLSEAKKSYEEARRLNVKSADLQELGTEIDAYEAWIKLLSSIVDPTGSEQTVANIVDEIEKENDRLESRGNPEEMQLRASYIDLLDEILPFFSNPANLEKYFDSSSTFREFIEKNL